MRISKILVATDFSRASIPAVELALGLAKGTGAAIDLLHVWDRPVHVQNGYVVGPPGTPPKSLEEFFADVRGLELDAWLRDLRESGVTASARVELGDPVGTIVRIARDERFDLIAVGAHGRRGISRWVAGSVAEEVLRRAPCPVVLVQQAASELADSTRPTVEAQP